jgi:signal transduction histidine kinase
VLHNGVALMRLLTDPDLDDRHRLVLAAQADAELVRMRDYLTSRAIAPADADGRHHDELVAVVDGACDGFPDLPIVRLLDLGAGVRVGTEQATALGAALTSVLLNVREHAGAGEVVVHLDADERGWTASVHDDGSGFVPEPARFGIGLREVVVGELGRHRMVARVESVPGAGTTVTITGADARPAGSS